jgi:hypothetical protein
VPTSAGFDTLASSFTLVELTGDKRTLQLTGRALPYKPYTLSGSQRNSIEWYNGNPVGVLQVYGAKEKETQISGMWKDMFLGETDHAPYASVNGSPLTTTIDLAELVDDIRRKGQEIKVTWLNHVRFGVLSDFTQKWQTGHDMEYEIEFAWTRVDDATLSQVPFTNTVASADLADAPNQMLAVVDQFDDASTSFANGFDPSAQVAVNAVDELSAEVADQTDELSDAVSQVTYTAYSTGQTASRISGIFDGIKLTASDMRDDLQDVVDGARLDIGGAFGGVLADRLQARQQADYADQAATLAASNQKKILSTMNSNNISVFVARDGDDLRRVSLTYYGTSDDWRALMLYNNLEDDALAAGQIILVPSNPPQEPET